MLAMLSYDFQKSEMIFVPENAYAHICKSIGNEVSSTAQKKKVIFRLFNNNCQKPIGVSEYLDYVVLKENIHHQLQDLDIECSLVWRISTNLAYMFQKTAFIGFSRLIFFSGIRTTFPDSFLLCNH